VARFRLGSEVRESKYWEGEEKKVCRICGGKGRHGNTCGKGEGGRRRWKEAGRKMWDGCLGMRGRRLDEENRERKTGGEGGGRIRGRERR